jgi:hypothetical protein
MSKAINRLVFCCKQVREKRKSVREIEDIVWIERNFRIIFSSFHRDISYYNIFMCLWNRRDWGREKGRGERDLESWCDGEDSEVWIDATWS